MFNNARNWILLKWLKFTGKLHWYQVKLTFNKNGTLMGHTTALLGVAKKEHIASRRFVAKKIVTDEFENRAFHGARVGVVITSYLGFFYNKDITN